MNPKYTVYIISKGRWESRQTSIGLEKMKVPYYIVIEPHEYKQYSKYIDKKKILVLPFSNLGQGSIPARNWVWQHSKSKGDKRHWIMDDNIPYFNRLNRNYQIRVTSGTIFKIMEDFVDRYENVALAGPSYDFFTIAKTKMPPFVINTRIYSVILIKNDIDFKWRGRYNEDTDLSLRVLKAGLCTIQFNAFTQEKATTMTMKGGNTNELYENTDNRKEFAQSLVDQHPDVAKVTWKYGRWHHQVNYKPFKKNKLIFRKDYVKKKGINNYGMKLIEL
jgi:hypothetical protein